MKRSIIIFAALILAIVFAFPAFSAISTPLVRIYLTKTVVITQEQLDEKFELYKQNYGESITQDDVLEAMISDELLAQAMARDGYTLTDEQKDELLAAQKQSIEEQLGTALTDEQFEYVLQTQAGTDVATYREYIAEQYLVQAYITNMKADMFKDESLIPSDSEIETFYKKNKSTLISPENVKLAHIYFKFNDDKAAAFKKASDVLTQIKNGKITFEKAVSQYSEDTDSVASAGEIGWLSIEDSDTMATMGENFFDKVFQLDAGDISDVIESNAGYHIVKVSVHNDTKILALTDKLSPTESTTVYDYIKSYLYSQNVNGMYTTAFKALIEDLKSAATIKYLTK
ncbi:MAG: peptidylprolyl isomerase [Spirochaetales bacterium]|nr:peptidylprolyl isomerase [Spirochaetales bacterium]